MLQLQNNLFRDDDLLKVGIFIIDGERCFFVIKNVMREIRKVRKQYNFIYSCISLVVKILTRIYSGKFNVFCYYLQIIEIFFGYFVLVFDSLFLNNVKFV